MGYPQFYLSIYLSINQSINQSINLFVHLSILLSIHPCHPSSYLSIVTLSIRGLQITIGLPTGMEVSRRFLSFRRTSETIWRGQHGVTNPGSRGLGQKVASTSWRGSEFWDESHGMKVMGKSTGTIRQSCACCFLFFPWTARVFWGFLSPWFKPSDEGAAWCHMGMECNGPTWH